jgi:hypothetical protein
LRKPLDIDDLIDTVAVTPEAREQPL